MKKIIIVDYSPESGKGNYRTSKGEIKRFYHGQVTGILPPGTFAYLHKNGKIEHINGLWNTIKYHFRRG